MNKLSKIVAKWGGIAASLALIIGVSTVNSPCYLYLHQPEVPAAMNRFKK